MGFGFQHLASQPGDNCCSWILPQASGLQVRCLEGLPEEEAEIEESSASGAGSNFGHHSPLVAGGPGSSVGELLALNLAACSWQTGEPEFSAFCIN